MPAELLTPEQEMEAEFIASKCGADPETARAIAREVTGLRALHDACRAANRQRLPRQVVAILQQLPRYSRRVRANLALAEAREIAEDPRHD